MKCGLQKRKSESSLFTTVDEGENDGSSPLRGSASGRKERPRPSPTMADPLFNSKVIDTGAFYFGDGFDIRDHSLSAVCDFEGLRFCIFAKCKFSTSTPSGEENADAQPEASADRFVCVHRRDEVHPGEIVHLLWSDVEKELRASQFSSEEKRRCASSKEIAKESKSRWMRELSTPFAGGITPLLSPSERLRFDRNDVPRELEFWFCWWTPGRERAVPPTRTLSRTKSSSPGAASAEQGKSKEKEEATSKTPSQELYEEWKQAYRFFCK